MTDDKKKFGSLEGINVKRRRQSNHEKALVVLYEHFLAGVTQAEGYSMYHTQVLQYII